MCKLTIILNVIRPEQGPSAEITKEIAYRICIFMEKNKELSDIDDSTLAGRYLMISLDCQKIVSLRKQTKKLGFEEIDLASGA